MSSNQNNGNGGPGSQHRRSIGPNERDRDVAYGNGGGGGAGGYGGGVSGRMGSAASLHNGVGGGSKDKEDWDESGGDRLRRNDGR